MPAALVIMHPRRYGGGAGKSSVRGPVDVL